MFWAIWNRHKRFTVCGQFSWIASARSVSRSDNSTSVAVWTASENCLSAHEYESKRSLERMHPPMRLVMPRLLIVVKRTNGIPNLFGIIESWALKWTCFHTDLFCIHFDHVKKSGVGVFPVLWHPKYTFQPQWIFAVLHSNDPPMLYSWGQKLDDIMRFFFPIAMFWKHILSIPFSAGNFTVRKMFFGDQKHYLWTCEITMII